MRALVIALISLAGIGSCSRPAGPPPDPVAAAPAAAASAAAVRPAVARVVFVGKQDACDCTRKAVDAGWKALEAALGPENRIPVERLQADTQEDKVAPYRSRQPFVALPAVYLLDASGNPIELFQGEVTEAKLRPLLARTAVVTKEKRP